MVTKAALICFSPTDGTRHVLSSIGEGFGLPCEHIDMTLPAARTREYTFTEHTLLVLGFPVYYGRVPQIQEEIFPRLQGTAKYALPVVVYGNRAYEDALAELADLCLQKGWDIAAAAAFIAEHSYSSEMGTKRPDNADRNLAVRFGAAVADSLKNGQTLYPPLIPGNRPYKTYGPKPPIVPTTTEACIECGICADVCPTEAIARDNPKRTITGLCIICSACIKKCPAQARVIALPAMIERIKAMAEANRDPKQPQIFLPK